MGARGRKSQAAVLSVLRSHGGALSAYEVLGELRRSNPTISAPTIYRALSALTESGQVHRLESRQAFIACRQAGQNQPFVLSICDACGAVEECIAPDLLAELSRVVGRSGFSVMRPVIEIRGQCASCCDGGAPA